MARQVAKTAAQLKRELTKLKNLIKEGIEYVDERDMCEQGAEVLNKIKDSVGIVSSNKETIEVKVRIDPGNVTGCRPEDDFLYVDEWAVVLLYKGKEVPCYVTDVDEW